MQPYDSFISSMLSILMMDSRHCHFNDAEIRNIILNVSPLEMTNEVVGLYYNVMIDEFL